MTDVVVTLPKSFGLQRWIDEGDAAGDSARVDTLAGERTYWWGVPSVPKINCGERVYVVHNRRLIGYSPLIEVRQFIGKARAYLVRGSGAVAVTIPEEIKGFRGYRYRWWDRAQEVSFPEWINL